MGCASSKRVETAVVADVYRPPPTSIAIFDINTVEEPWLITATVDSDEIPPEPEKKPAASPAIPIFEKLDSLEQAPQSWSEISKALENLKPSLNSSSPAPATTQATIPATATPPKNQSFRTLEELEKKLKSEKNAKNPPPQLSSASLSSPARSASRVQLPEGVRPVTQNSFLLRDKEEREKKAGGVDDDPIRRWRRNPMDGLPEICPPGGADSVVLYTTSLRGVRRTFDDCERARQLVELQCLGMVDVDERDISLHGEYLKQLRELVGEEAAVPRLFVKGRYVGGVNEVVEFNETGRLRLILRLARSGGGGAGEPRGACGGCGGARFVPCLECNGSRKVVVEKEVARCGRCNENGLVQCPLCRGSE